MTLKERQSKAMRIKPPGRTLSSSKMVRLSLTAQKDGHQPGVIMTTAKNSQESPGLQHCRGPSSSHHGLYPKNILSDRPEEGEIILKPCTIFAFVT